MNLFKKIGSRSSTIRELFSYLWQNRLWWMIPFMFVFLTLGILIIFAKSSAVVPFIYTLF
jgi:uncharacterized membrane protein